MVLLRTVSGVLIRIVSEDALTNDERSACWTLFPRRWSSIPGNDQARAWTQQQPRWRVLACAAETGEIIGQAGLVDVTADGVIGISDVAVSENHRLCGAATLMLTAAVRYADERGVPVIVDTGNTGLRRVLGRLGFDSTVDEAVLVTEQGHVTMPNWMHRGALRGAVLRMNF
jgi:RimJ/RimL family protein N-acetyltransferase